MIPPLVRVNLLMKDGTEEVFGFIDIEEAREFHNTWEGSSIVKTSKLITGLEPPVPRGTK